MGRKQRENRRRSQAQDVARRDAASSSPPKANDHWTSRPRAAVALLAATILSAFAGSLPVNGWSKLRLSVAGTALVLAAVYVGVLPIWRWFFGHRSIVKYSLMAITGVVIVALGAWIVTQRKPAHDAVPTVQAPAPALILVASFEGPDSRSEKNYRVTDYIQSRLSTALQSYRDVQVAALGSKISEADGSRNARLQGEKRHASIVIWGWYGTTKTSAVLSVHFEVLARHPAYALPASGTSIGQGPRTYSLTALNSFVIQQDLSREMVFLTELTVGIVRTAARDWDGAVRHFNGAVTASRGRSNREQALAYFYRGM